MKTTRLLSLLLCATLVFTLLPIAAFAAGIWDGGATQPVGVGTPLSPYRIGTGRELKWFANRVNGGDTGIHAILTADILLNDTGNWQNWATSPPANTWTPIGNAEYIFKGVFDGQGYTVSGVYINGTDSYQGLFGYIGAEGTGTVKNVKVASSYIKGQSYVGGICGYMSFFSEISGCASGATVIGTIDYSGGIAGIIVINSSLRNCRNTGSVTGGNCTGGIAGSSNGTVTDCANQGTVGGSGSWIGGLIGMNYSALSNSYNNGNVSVSIGNYVGGVCGTNGEGGTIANVYSTGSVTGGWSVCGYTMAGSSITNVYFLGSPLNNGLGSHAGAGTTVNISAQQFASGEAAYLMGATYGQTLGSGGDPLPVFRTSDNSNAVYRLTYMNEAAVHATQYYNAGDAVSSDDITPPIMNGGAFLDWEGLPDTMPAQDVTATANSTPAPPQIMTASLPSGAAHKAYSTRIEATGTAPIAFSVVSGALPAGLTLNKATGEITGTPVEAGSSTLVIRAQNDYGQNDKEFILDVSDEMPGNGGSNDPYQIWTASHLIQFADKVNTTADTRFYAVLMADIALNDTSDWEDWGTTAPANTWTPIGINPTYSFKGGFDGSNHTISGVYINSSDNNVGLFGHISAATTVKNLNLLRSYIKGNENVGGICGSLMTLCKLENCRNAAVVTGAKYIGGVCGSVTAANASILNCQNDGIVTGPQQAGGIAGVNSGTVDACRNSGTVQGGVSGNAIGGICGNNGGAISSAYSTGSVSGNLNIGGICGLIGGLSSNIATLTNVYNSGNVTGPANSAAICGATNVYCSLTGCYYLVSSATSGIGYNAASYAAVSNTAAQYASGEVAYALGAAFGQTLNTDDAPVFRVSDPNNAVYRLTYKNGETQHAVQYYNAGNTVSAEAIEPPTSGAGSFLGWDTLPTEMPAEDVIASAMFGNTPPVAKATVPTQNVEEGATTNFDADDIAEDAENDTLTITAIVTVPTFGTATASLGGNGVVTITGVAAGSTSVTVTVSDGTDTVDVTVPIEVASASPVNNPPTAKATTPTQSVKAGETTGFDADDIAEDANNDTLTITAIVTIPASGTAMASLSNGTVTITGVAAGSTSVTVTVSDGTDTVDVTVPIEVVAASPGTYALTITGGTGGSITQGSSGNYAAGAVINIAASPDANYAFAGWTSSGGGVFGDADSAATTFTMPAQSVTITASFIYTGSSGGGPAPTYRTRLLRDSATGIQISGSAIHRRAVLTVKDMALHPEGCCTACDAIRKAQNDNQLILGFDIDLTQGFHGSLTISVPVDNRHDGQTVTMLHCINGRLETLTATVVNGQATFTVTSLSPFAVTSGLLTPDFVVTDPPKTGDAAAQTGYVMLGLTALCALYPVMRRRKKERG